jgi:hypothetical protein
MSGGEAELGVCLDRVGTGILELVRLQLVHEADAAPFLQQIEDDSLPFLRHPLERAIELVAAVAARGVKDVAGQA